MRLPEYAENSFATACSFADAIAHPPRRDQNGWDYMVEFGGKNRSGHSDMHPAASKAFVQIKSSSNPGRACSVKLSNALKAAQSRWPWFVVLYIASRGPAQPQIFAKHIWDKEIAQTLREVRVAENKGMALNKKKVTIAFVEADRKSAEELIAWMETCIDLVKPDYSAEKRRIYDTVGFENGYAVGQLALLARDEETFFANFLGLGDGLSGTQFTVTPTRFGIMDKSPEVSLDNVTVHITPSSVGECEMRMRGPPSEPMISIAAKVYVLREPIVSSERLRFRFSGLGFELVWSVDGYCKFEYNIDYEKRFPLRDIVSLATFMRWVYLGPVKIEIWTATGRAMVGRLNMAEPAQRRFDWDILLEITKMLRSLAGDASESNLEASIAEFNRGASDLRFMQQIFDAPSLKIDFIPIGQIPQGIETAVYYLRADVGDLTAYALVERPVKGLQEADGGRKTYVFGAALTHATWVVQKAVASIAMVEGDYDRFIEERAGGPPLLELKDLRQMHKGGL